MGKCLGSLGWMSLGAFWEPPGGPRGPVMAGATFRAWSPWDSSNWRTLSAVPVPSGTAVAPCFRSASAHAAVYLGSRPQAAAPASLTSALRGSNFLMTSHTQAFTLVSRPKSRKRPRSACARFSSRFPLPPSLSSLPFSCLLSDHFFSSIIVYSLPFASPLSRRLRRAGTPRRERSSRR